MIRSSAIISFAVSLLLWSGQVLGSGPQEANTQGSEGAAESVAVHPTPDCPQTACPVPCPTHGQQCPRLTHRHAAGQPCPLAYGLGQRLGKGGGRPPCPLFAPQPLPAAPSGGFFGTVGMPRRYQYDQPYMQPQMSMPTAYPMQVPAAAGQPAAYPQGQYPQGQPGQGYPGYVMPPANERIVYIPYAMPPPITVERLAKALPIPKPITLRRILGDANMYEYPEMPLHLYTTRGPRDFLAPNPPGIGE